LKQQISLSNEGYLPVFHQTLTAARALVRTPTGFILLIIVPFSLIVIIEIRNIVKELRKPKRPSARWSIAEIAAVARAIH